MEGKLKIIFYTDTYLPAIDGVVTSIINTKRELEKRGHSVYVFASGDDRSKPIKEIGKNVFAVPGIKFRKYPQYRIALFTLPVAMKFNSIKPDIVHLHTPFTMGLSGLAMAKLNKVPAVATFHTFFTRRSVLKEYGTSSKIGQKLIAKYSWPYARFFFNKCDKIIAPSQFTKKVLKRHGIPNTVTVPNSVDIKRFKPKNDTSRLRKELKAKRADRIVLYVGRISKEKSIDVMIKVAELLKDKNLVFVFAGTGPALHHFQHIVHLKKLQNVRFTGFVSTKQLPKYYAAADIFCTPSTFETQGITILEALASGKPVVGANCEVISEIIKNGKNGEKFEPGNPRSCANKIEKVINKIESYKDMSSSVSRYSVQETTDTLLKVYEEIILSKERVNSG